MDNQSDVRPELLAAIEKKQKERDGSFAQLRNVHCLDEEAKSIVNLPVVELLQKLRNRSLSAKQVLGAYIAKALEVTEEFNCVTEFIPQASKWAAILDDLPEPLPLHGIPVGIKEDHNVEGMDTTMGFAKNLGKPAAESSVLVKVLLKLGAVPFVKTNLPQSIFSTGSSNPIFGTTLNALNKKLGPGGSSSGSGCIVAAGGAVIATGSDLGGSLRIPSLSHGICTIRPTTNRLSGKGVVQCLDNLTIPGVPGIISRDVETLSLVWKLITEDCIQNSLDPFVVPIPWNEQLFSSKNKLKIGYFDSLPYFPSFADTRNTLHEAKKAFELMGHTLVEFEVPDTYHMIKVLGDLYFADKGKYLKEMFDGEPISRCVAGLVKLLRNPETVPENSSRREQVLGNGADVKTSKDLLNVLNEKRAITLDTLGRMEKAGVDLVLSPAFPLPAVKIQDSHALHPIVYTAIWNLMDFPAGVIPFGKETGANWDSYDDEGDYILKAAKEAIQESKGMPINVQLIARPFKEELVLRGMLELEKFRRNKID